MKGRVLASAAAFFVLPLLLFSLLFESLSPLTALLAAAAVPFLLSVLLYFLRKELAFSVGSLLAAIYLAVYFLTVLGPALAMEGRSGVFTVRAVGYPESRTTCGMVEGKLLSDGPAVRVSVVLSDASPDGIAPGDLLTVEGYITRRNSKAALHDAVVLSVCQSGGVTVTPRGSDGFACRMLRFSHAASERLFRLFGGDKGALLAALLCGDRSLFSAGFQNALRSSGLTHVSAVSGLHISILFALCARLLGKKAGFILSVPLVVCYAVLTGGSPSVIRASVMGVFFLSSLFSLRQYDGITSLLFSAAVIGALNPFALTSASFLLSFASTLGILLFAPAINRGLSVHFDNRLLNRFLSFLRNTFAVTLSATVFTLPLSLLFFREISLISLFSNILALWAVPFCMIGGILTLAVASLFPAAAPVFVALTSLPLDHFIGTVYLTGEKLRLTASTDNIYVILTVALLFCLSCLIYLKKISALAGLSAVLLAFVCCFGCSFAEERLYSSVYIYGDAGSSVVFAGRKGCSVIHAPRSYTADRFLSRFSALSPDLLLLQKGGDPEGLTAFSSVYRPESDGEVPLAACRTQVFRFGDGFAALSDADGLTLLDVTAVTPAGFRPLDLSCDLLLIDGDWAESRHFLSVLCSYARPSAVLVSLTGWEATLPDESTTGCPVLPLNQFEYLRFIIPR